MKRMYIISAVILALTMLLTPLAGISGLSGDEQSPDTGKEPRTTDIGDEPENEVNSDSFFVKSSKTGEVTEFPAITYLIGVVAAEIGDTSPDEAVKAQTVAAYTMAVRKVISNNQSEEDRAKYGDFADDPDTFQAFYTPEKVKASIEEKYYEKRYALIKANVESVFGEILTYGGEPALSVYHGMSGGKTESAANIWGGKYDYLIPVESVSDILEPDYASRAEFTAGEIEEAFSGKKSKFSDDKSEWFTDPKTSESGTVLSINIGGVSVTGSDVRGALNLRSASFDVEYDKDAQVFLFNVRGWGHGVGMSQQGAISMAKDGSGYREILAWYYPGCEIVKYE